MSQSREAVQRQADRQVQELEEALGDVQKRMLDSEAKVKQLQAHVVAVKEHLGGQVCIHWFFLARRIPFSPLLCVVLSVFRNAV